MFTEAISSVSEYVASLGFDATKDYFKEKIDEKKLQSTLTSYIESQRKYNEICTLAEEIDFQGLVEFIRNSLLDITGTRIFDPSPKKRGQARKQIVDAAIAHSGANTDEAKLRVSKCVSICLDIIREFYKSNHLSIKDFLLADMIVDTVLEKVDKAKDQILTKIDEGGSLFSIDRAVGLAENGNIGTIGTGIRKVLDHISLTHPYAPDFGYEYKNGMIVSKPLTVDAKKLYPPKIVLTGSVKIGKEYFNDANDDPLSYAYRHQLPIKMEVSKAIKLLGEKPDPIQDDVKGLVGNTVLATPPEFPPAFPCAIKVGNKSFFDYVLLRTQGIEDDGTYVISNEEQEDSFYFEVRINPNNPSKPIFKINMSNANNHELLNYARFINALSKEKDLHIYVLPYGRDIIAGYINGINNMAGISDVEWEIDFLERVCAIEDYFKVRLTPCGEISKNEFNAVLYISDLIRKNQVTWIWSEVTFTGVMSQHFRKELASLDRELYMFSYVGINHFDLFGAKFDFRFTRTFKSAIMVDVDKVRRKADVLDDGDDIKITFRAGDDNEAIDTLEIPEQLDRTS